MSKHVAVLMGGWSAEREISLRSGRACADAAERAGFRVTRVDVGRDIATVLTAAKPDVALNVLHGRPGEDGTLQGMLEILAIPYKPLSPACLELRFCGLKGRRASIAAQAERLSQDSIKRPRPPQGLSAIAKLMDP